VDGSPTPRLSWSKRGGSLPLHGRYKLPPNYFNSQLDLFNIQQSDEGDYICTAHSTRGTRKTVIRLQVQGACVYMCVH